MVKRPRKPRMKKVSFKSKGKKVSFFARTKKFVKEKEVPIVIGATGAASVAFPPAGFVVIGGALAKEIIKRKRRKKR